MKDKAPVYSSISEVRQGSKILGLVVGEADHGYVIRTFGGLKGLLTYADVKANSSLIKGELKSGSIVKSFVLFVKKGSGMALTLNKKSARKGQEEEDQAESKSILESYFPNSEQLAQIKSTYSQFQKASQSENLVGRVFTFRVTEAKENYYVVKTIEDKKTKVAILPKCLVSSFGVVLPLEESDFSFKAIVL